MLDGPNCHDWWTFDTCYEKNKSLSGRSLGMGLTCFVDFRHSLSIRKRRRQIFSHEKEPPNQINARF
jgi:hypothetical protein